ncbi:sodium/solute symporter [bacterium]|nr:sodium/solute symporter [bacterium]
MQQIDWLIVFGYIVLIIGISIIIGRRQKTQEDYYLAGRSMGAWKIAMSIVATQVSAISLIGVPAFVAANPGGGLVWLQYEFAVPIAMILIMTVLLPVYHRLRVISIYEYLEKRFGREVRLLLSMVFLISRGLGSGVMLLATSILTAACLDLDIVTTIVIMGVVSIIYTSVGGITADIYSDIIQLAVLWISTIILFGIVLSLINFDTWSLTAIEQQRLNIFDFQSTGLGDGQTFGFWPMLFGGLFLYFSYYGCDQSQAQRFLTTPTVQEARKSLFLNGLLRFPLVMTYCAFGVLLIPFLIQNPAMAEEIKGVGPDYLVPYFLLEYVPKGFLGLVVSGIFAASMSSLDSSLNSLSASTWRDIILNYYRSALNWTPRNSVLISRVLTVVWGVICTGFAVLLTRSSDTVIELINKIGSVFYGPVAAIFVLGILIRSANQTGAIVGLAAGVSANIGLWFFAGQSVSWLWWNPTGFLISFFTGIVLARITGLNDYVADDGSARIKKSDFYSDKMVFYSTALIVGFVFILMICLLIESFLQKFFT